MAQTVSLLLVLALGQGQGSASGAAAQERTPVLGTNAPAGIKEAKVMEKKIIACFKGIDAPLLVDLPFTLNDFLSLKLSNDVHSLERVSVMWDRRLTQNQGAYVVHRTLPTKFELAGWGGSEVFLWLDQLRSDRPDTFAGLVQGGVDFDDLDEDGKQMVSNYWGGSMGAVNGAANGTPVNVSLGFIPMTIRTDSAGHQSFVNTRPQPGRDGLHSPVKALPTKSYRAVPFSKSGDGDIDFGDGKVVTLLELSVIAGDKFHLREYIDDRLQESPVFVKGKFTKNRFMAALALIGKAPLMGMQEIVTGKALYALEASVLKSLIEQLGDKADPATLAYMKKLASDGRDPLDPSALGAFGLDFPPADPSLSVSLGLTINMRSTTILTDNGGNSRTVPISGTVVFPGR